MPGIARLRMNLRSAIALGTGVACVALGAAPALAVSPSPPPGAPAVESAPSSLVGLDPELPASVVSASAASGSHWTPEKAAYGTASTNDIRIKGAGGTTIRVNEIYPTTASGSPAKGPFPVLLTMTPYGKGQGGSSSPGSAASPGRRESPPAARTTTWPSAGTSRSSRTSAAPATRTAAGACSTRSSSRTRSRSSNWAAHLPALGRARRHLRTVVSGDRPVAARRRGRPALAAQGDLPDGQRQRHLPRHLVHGRAARLRVR